MPVSEGLTAKPVIKIMPLGDSITQGMVATSSPDSDLNTAGGYRRYLWSSLIAIGFNVVFVGSFTDCSPSLEWQNHNGYVGWHIQNIRCSVDLWLKNYQPDIILLMIGTNDTKTSCFLKMVWQLNHLIAQITVKLSQANLLIASIPLLNPVKQPASRIWKAAAYNQAIPFLVKFHTIQGKKVRFVDMRSLKLSDLTSSLNPDWDNGLHPNTQGYQKIAKFWYDSILEVLKDIQSS